MVSLCTERIHSFFHGTLTLFLIFATTFRQPILLESFVYVSNSLCVKFSSKPEIQSSSLLQMPQRRHAVASLQVAVEINEIERYVDLLFVGHLV